MITTQPAEISHSSSFVGQFVVKEIQIDSTIHKA